MRSFAQLLQTEGNRGPTARRWLHPDTLARNLVHGAMCELRLTPKPGLVDLRDHGSHPDLTYSRMSRSAGMLAAYFRELLEVDRRRGGFAACIEAGRRAEDRMLITVRANAHRGYVFLGGLTLLAACRESDDAGDLRLHAAAIAEEFFGLADRSSRECPRDGAERRAAIREETHGCRVRREHSLGGIRGEALAGLPSVFEVGLPAFTAHFSSSHDFVLSSHYLLACLMQQVEDTTSVHRCGPAGLERIRCDGAILQRVIEDGGDHLALLEAWNEEYREMRLTMGGVADCLGLTLALYFSIEGLHDREIDRLQGCLLEDRHRMSEARAVLAREAELVRDAVPAPRAAPPGEATVEEPVTDEPVSDEPVLVRSRSALRPEPRVRRSLQGRMVAV